MAFSDLHEHVQQTFAEFMGYDEYDAQLTIWCHRTRFARAEQQRERYLRNPMAAYRSTKAWRKANPEKQRALDTRHKKQYRAKYPDKARAQKQRYRDKHREHVREVNRRNQAARRARLKAEAEARRAA